jgi:endoribonuclease LACTB2
MTRSPYPPVFPDPSRPPRAAAAVLLLQPGDPARVFVVRRNPKLRFLGGFGGYPGGRVDQDDAVIAGEDDRMALPVAEVAAVRELFEEAGVLLLPGADEIDDDTLDGARRALLGGDTSFADLCGRLGLPPRPAPGTLVPAGRWVTPLYSPLRYDTHYFVHLYTGRREPSVWHGELVEGAWTTPDAVLDRWRRWDLWLAPPVTETLEELAAGITPVDDLQRRLIRRAVDRGHAFQPVRMRHGLRLLALMSRPLPPAIFTNAYLVGESELVLVDPGAAPGEPRDILMEQLDRLVAEGRRLHSVVLTHHHLDHVDSAEAVRERYGVPLAAHPLAAQDLRDARRAPYRPEVSAIEVDHELPDGHVIDLEGGFSLEVVHTPGHARGHVCLVERASKSLIAGDLVSGLSPVVIDPSGDQMTVYRRSLQDVIDRGDYGLFAAHGPPHTSSRQRLELVQRDLDRREERRG